MLYIIMVTQLTFEIEFIEIGIEEAIQVGEEQTDWSIEKG